MVKTKLIDKAHQVDFENDDEVDKAVGNAVRNALREHKRLGQSVAVWQDGKVVILAPEDIPVELTSSME